VDCEFLWPHAGDGVEAVARVEVEDDETAGRGAT
jgi:hypothetical protein